VSEYDLTGVAAAAGADEAYVENLVALGVLQPASATSFTAGDIRRIALVAALERAGLPLTGIAEAMRKGRISLAVMDQPAFTRFVSLETTTFRELATRSGIPLELLTVVREATGSAQPDPDDRVRSNELELVPFLEFQLEHGIRPAIIERLLRVSGDSFRRIAETDADLWRTDVMEPLFASGRTTAEIGERLAAFSGQYVEHADRALLGLFHGQRGNAGIRNLFERFERALVEAGLHATDAIPPAICFLDLTGYTRLTEERGDQAAADLAGQLARLVQRTSAAHGGKVIKWLGDGVMFQYQRPDSAVLAALEMVDGVRETGLPPAHVGVHAGPVLFQEGDYFGRTVNAAARIAEYARQGEVLVSREVVETMDGSGLVFSEIGEVQLKGLAGPLALYAAHGDR
jgi:adenylate cyclase